MPILHFTCLVFRKKDLYLVITQKLIFLKSTQNLIKSDVSTKTLQFGGVQGGGYDPGFHEIERPLARNCNPMFYLILLLYFLFLVVVHGKVLSIDLMAPRCKIQAPSYYFPIHFNTLFLCPPLLNIHFCGCERHLDVLVHMKSQLSNYTTGKGGNGLAN